MTFTHVYIQCVQTRLYFASTNVYAHLQKETRRIHMQICSYTRIHTNMHRYIKDTNACTRNVHHTFKLYITHVNVHAYFLMCDDIKSWVIKSTCRCLYAHYCNAPHTHVHKPYTHIHKHTHTHIHKHISQIFTHTHVHTHKHTNSLALSLCISCSLSRSHIYTRTNTQTLSPSRFVFLALCLARSLTFSFYLPSLTLSLSLSHAHTHIHTAMAMLDDVMEAMAKFPGAGDRYVASFMPHMLLSAMSVDVGYIHIQIYV